ncbi:MAG TPA: HAMP domain-containing sensor histidine kinase [Alphaproteobacteria bacterium]|nr:HAMP domain-containing sensor histidine kinase [Alphaproteobacteria bacterium]
MGTLRKRSSHQYEEMGRLTQGLLHNINNTLGSIAGFAEFLTEDLEEGSPTHSFAENIKSASDHLKDLVRQMWTLNAIGEISYDDNTDIIDLSEVIESQMLQISETLYKNMKISLALNIADELSDTKIIGHHGYVTQMFLELLGNAIESYEEITQGKEKIISITILKSPNSKNHLSMLIEDNGEGMDKDVLKQCRTPFFSYKDASEHHGLGLSVVDAILKTMNEQK